MTGESEATSHAPPARWTVSLAELDDGRPLCLSLANTRHWRNSAAPRETLNRYADLAQWALVKEIVTAPQSQAWERDVVAHPQAAAAELGRAIALREAIARLFSARAQGRTPAETELAAIIASFNEASKSMQLAIVDGRLVPGFTRRHPGFELPRWQAAVSAIGLLTSAAVPRVKQCADERGCGWLFLDRTRNGSRQFCFSSECGNRARQAKFRARLRAEPVHPHSG